MVAEITGVVYVVEPDVNAVPPDEAAYQSIVWPAVVVEDIPTVPVPQRDPATPVGDEGTAFIVATTAVRVGDKQPAVVFLACA